MSFDREFRARALAVLTLGLIFGAGFGIGLAVERNLIAGAPDEPRTEEQVAERGDSDERDDDRGLIVEQVGLTAEQKVLVQETVDQIWERMREVTREKREVDREFNERSRQIIQEGRAAVMKHLTEEQRLEYERLLEEADERRRERRRRDGNDDRDDRDDPDPNDPTP